MARHFPVPGGRCDVGRGGVISLIAICLFSVSGCLPKATAMEEHIEKPVTFFEGQVALIEERPTVIVNEEVNEERRAWHSAVWKFAAKWGGYLWRKILGGWGLTKEAGSTAVEFGINYAAIAYEWGRPYANGIISVSEATLNSVTSSAPYKKALDVLSNPGAFVDTYGRLSKFSKNLDWSRVNPIPFLIRGTRGVPRSLEAAEEVWKTVPRAIRAAGPEAVARFLASRDWSHIYPYSLGGSNDPLNGIFEDRSINRARGNAIMKPSELRAAQAALRSNAFHATLQQTAQGTLRGGVLSAAFLAVVAVLELGLQYQEGEITAETFYLELGKTIGAAGLTGAAVSGLVTVMALSFPAIIPVVTVISVPLAIVGFSVLGSRLVRAGKGWYEVFLDESKLKPAALLYWLVRRYEIVRGIALGGNVQIGPPLMPQYLAP